MNNKIKMFIPLVLTFVMFLGSTCFASGGRGINPNLYDNDTLNSQVIQEFNNYSATQQAKLLKDLFPLMVQRLGFKMNDSYSALDLVYRNMLNVKKLKYDSDANAFFNSDEDNKYYYVYYLDDEYHWYKELSQYLINVVSVQSGQFVVEDTQFIYDITNQYIEDFGESAGIVKGTILSYKNINSANFPNLTIYNDFISVCETYKNNGTKYVLVAQSDKSYYYVASFNGTFYNNGSVLGQTVALIDNSGNRVTMNFCKPLAKRWGTGNTFERNQSYIYNTTVPLSSFGSSDIPSRSVGSWSGSGVWGGYWSIYTLSDTKEDIILYTSRESWINHNGHFEYPYELASYYNNVPTTTITSRDMTNTYNNIVNDNSNNSINNNTTNIYYPNDYQPTDNNSYDKENHILDFSGVGSLLSSLGSFIGSIINGIAQGIANIISSLVSVVQNLTNLTDSGFLGFMSAIFSWLPTEFITIITATLTLIVLFGVIRLIRG